MSCINTVCAALRARPDICKQEPTCVKICNTPRRCKLHAHTAPHFVACRDIAGCFHFAETLQYTCCCKLHTCAAHRSVACRELATALTLPQICDTHAVASCTCTQHPIFVACREFASCCHFVSHHNYSAASSTSTTLSYKTAFCGMQRTC